MLANYTLAPETTMDVIVDQARQAVTWVARNFAEAGGIVVSGHSAGAQLILMAILNDGGNEGSALPITAGIPISGVFDLEPLRHTTINDTIRLDEASVARNSPIRLIRPSPVPLLVATGADETADFRGQSTRFVEAWRAEGNRADLFFADAANHFTVLRAFADPTGDFQQQVWDFFDAV